MIKKENVMVHSVEKIAHDTYELTIKSDYVSKHAIPGQFLHIKIAGFTLRRPLSIAMVNKEKELVTLLFKIFGAGTERLASYEYGMKLDVLGPCGNGFNLEKGESDQTALLIGGGIGVPPVYFLASELSKRGVDVISIIGFQEKSHVFYENEFKLLGQTLVVTNDGSYGKKGFVTDILDEVTSFDTFYSCGPKAMLKAVSEKLKNRNGYLSFEERMGCGVGVCYACVLPTKDGLSYKKICSDGPVFNINEVSL